MAAIIETPRHGARVRRENPGAEGTEKPHEDRVSDAGRIEHMQHRGEESGEDEEDRAEVVTALSPAQVACVEERGPRLPVHGENAKFTPHGPTAPGCAQRAPAAPQTAGMSREVC